MINEQKANIDSTNWAGFLPEKSKRFEATFVKTVVSLVRQQRIDAARGEQIVQQANRFEFRFFENFAKRRRNNFRSEENVFVRFYTSRDISFASLAR